MIMDAKTCLTVSHPRTHLEAHRLNLAPLWRCLPAGQLVLRGPPAPVWATIVVQVRVFVDIIVIAHLLRIERIRLWWPLPGRAVHGRNCSPSRPCHPERTLLTSSGHPWPSLKTELPFTVRESRPYVGQFTASVTFKTPADFILALATRGKRRVFQK
jgi:hypothetical protein